MSCDLRLSVPQNACLIFHAYQKTIAVLAPCDAMTGILTHDIDQIQAELTRKARRRMERTMDRIEGDIVSVTHSDIAVQVTTPQSARCIHL